MPPDSAGTCESQVRTPARTVSAAGSVKGTGERHQNEAVTATAQKARHQVGRQRARMTPRRRLYHIDPSFARRRHMHSRLSTRAPSSRCTSSWPLPTTRNSQWSRSQDHSPPVLHRPLPSSSQKRPYRYRSHVYPHESRQALSPSAANRSTHQLEAQVAAHVASEPSRARCTAFWTSGVCCR